MSDQPENQVDQEPAAAVEEGPSKREKLRASTIYQAILLGGFALIASAMLASGDATTAPAIQLRQQEDMLNSLNQVVPPKLYDNKLLDEAVTLEGTQVYIAKLGGKPSAVAFKYSDMGGYAGEITLIMGIKADGEILGVRVLKHAETPGLGDKIEEKKSDWIFGFNGLSLTNTPDKDWKVKKDGGKFDQFSGATISPRAVVRGVKNGLDFFKRNQATLFQPKATPEVGS